MNKYRPLLLKLLPYIGLFLLLFLVFKANYVSNTYLIGWDSVQNELNPEVNFKRALFASWQEYQSFGLVSGMAHASDLLRALFIWGLSFVLNQSVIRYYYHFLMLLIGSWGAFTLLKYAFKSEGKNTMICFVGAAFYVLNLGTVQIFALPFEPFSTFFAFLPWELFVFLKYVESEDGYFGRSFLYLAIINLLATPQAYLQTLFVVYFITVALFSLGYFIVCPNKKKFILKAFVAGITIFIINSFWLLPQIYFLNTSYDVVKESKINQLATEIVFNQNQEKGNIDSFIKLEGFYYDLFDVYRNKVFEAWHIHFDNPVNRLLPYFIALIVFFSIFRKKRLNIPFFFILFFVGVVLLTDTPVFGQLSEILRQSSFLNQIFRSSFTKFIVPFVLVYTYFFTSGLDVFHEHLLKLDIPIIKNLLSLLRDDLIYGLGFLILVLGYSYPIFTGHFFADPMRVDIPDDYVEVFSYLDSQSDKNKRIALLPDYTFWGWFKNFWGYEGSGFIWYAVEQPVVSRTFDVWSFNSESYFWEIKDAVEKTDLTAFEQILSKYDINYMLYDNSVFAVSSTQNSLQRDQLSKLISETDMLEPVVQNKRLTLYEVKNPTSRKNFGVLASPLPSVGPSIKLTNRDSAYFDVATYKTQTSGDVDYYFPFLDLFSSTDLKSPNWKILENEDTFVLSSKIKVPNVSEYTLSTEGETIKSKQFINESFEIVEQDVKVLLNGDTIEVIVPKVLVNDFNLGLTDPQQCSKYGGDTFTSRNPDGSISVSASDRGVVCFGYEAPLLAHWNGFLLRVDNTTDYGRELFFYTVGNKTRKQSKLETYLHTGTNYFILPTGNAVDDGYFFSFQNQSYTYTDSQNTLSGLKVYLLPYDYIKDIHLIKNSLLEDLQRQAIIDAKKKLLASLDTENSNILELANIESPQDLALEDISLTVENKELINSVMKAKFANASNVQKLNYYTYEVKNISAPYNNFVLYQSFDAGWHAYILKNPTKWDYIMPFRNGEIVQEHYLVNNWANGWNVHNLANDEVLIVTFWPQWLEYIGFGLFIFSAALLGFSKVAQWVLKRRNIAV